MRLHVAAGWHVEPRRRTQGQMQTEALSNQGVTGRACFRDPAQASDAAGIRLTDGERNALTRIRMTLVRRLVRP